MGLPAARFLRAAISFLEDFVGMVQDCPNCLQNVVVPRDATGAAGKLPLPITTPRLVLRRLSGADWKDLLDIMSDEALYRFLDGEFSDEEHIIQFLERDRELRLVPGVRFYLGIQSQAEGKLIGYAQFWLEDETRCQAGLRLVIAQPSQRQGCGTEAVQGLLRFGFEGLRLHRITAAADSRDEAGLRMLAKAGFRREGEFVKGVSFRSEWITTVWHALLNEEYAAQTPAAEQDSQSA